MKKKVIKEFCIEYFASLKCKISKDKDVITVDGLPHEFEQFVGKNGPYQLSFDAKSHALYENSELMVKGNYLLKAMRDFMQDRAQVCVLKASVTDLKKMKQILQFTFLSTSQYLNEKEQTINSILVQDGKIINVKLGELTDGNIDETSSIDTSADLKIAKENLIKKLSKSHEQIKNQLKEKLAKEIYRIKKHYENQRKEEDENLVNAQHRLEITQLALNRAYYDEEKNKLESKKQRFKEQIQQLTKKNYFKRLKEEEVFFIQDETQKHSLNIEHRLLNVSIILLNSSK